MGKVKEINVKNRTYYFFTNMINTKNFHSKSYKDIDIYYISYITIKKFGDCENIHSVYPLYLIIHSSAGYFKEENNEKYLILDSTDKYEKFSSGIRSEFKTLNGGKELLYKKKYGRIGINTEDDLPLNKPLKSPTLTIIIGCALQEGEKLYPQIYLEECLYEL